MNKVNRDDLSYLGIDYQNRLIAQILTDRKFANSIIDIINPNYFKDQFLKIIVAVIKDAKVNDDIVPDISSIEFRLLENVKDEVQQKYVIKTLAKIKESDLYDSLKVQDMAMKFCRYQELKKSLKEMEQILDRGNRKPIRTGIKGLDDIMDGGLSKGELAIILAPFGVGKTTMITKLANTAVTDGYNVLQIFFEDNPKVIQRKHLSCWSGLDLKSLSMNKDHLIEMCDTSKNKNEIKGVLKLKKFSSDGTTMPIIRQYIRRLIAQGFRPDLVLLDYIDCVQPSRHYDDVNVGEGSVMRQFETMLFEFDIAGWTAVQGNRSSIGANVVEAHQMGGSIKKGQIGHFIVSIAKTLDQKNNGTATMAILKSRFGVDGEVLEDVIFNNGTMQIDMGEKSKKVTIREHEEKVVKDEQLRVNRAFERKKIEGQMLINKLD